MLKLKLQYLDYLMRRANSLEKDLMLGKIIGRDEKEATQDEMVRWHHWANGHKFEQIWGTVKEKDGEGNGNPPQYSCLENPMDRGA